MLFIPELKSKPEYWVDALSPTVEEARQHTLIQEKVFEIEPKYCELNQNDSVIISFKYNHKACGKHNLPVLLSIKQGKQIILNLKGETVESDSLPLVSATLKSPIYLQPTMIGSLEHEVSTQYVALYNHSCVDVRYTVCDSSVQEQTCQVFQILNTHGCIKAKSFANIEVQFNPIKEAVYDMNIKIKATPDFQNSHTDNTFGTDIDHISEVCYILTCGLKFRIIYFFFFTYTARIQHKRNCLQSKQWNTS